MGCTVGTFYNLRANNIPHPHIALALVENDASNTVVHQPGERQQNRAGHHIGIKIQAMPFHKSSFNIYC